MRLAALRATSGLVGETLFLIELLFTLGEDEFLAAVLAL